MIGIVDYNAGNITSVERALQSLKIEYIRSKNPSDLANCSKLIFPGVGDAEYAMKQLHETGFDTFLKDWANAGKEILGICLGSQIIFDYSEEGNTNCLGLIKGTIRHFANIDPDLKSKGFKIPHMGWNNLQRNDDCKLLQNVPENSDFYFVHSYVICPEENSVIMATADYGIKVPAIIKSGSVYACQFHPEKSGKPGLQILKNFVEL